MTEAAGQSKFELGSRLARGPEFEHARSRNLHLDSTGRSILDLFCARILIVWSYLL